MYEELVAAVRQAPPPATPAQLRELLGAVDHLQGLVVAGLGEIDAAGLCELEGATSTVAWLRSEAGMTKRDAGWFVQAARRLRRLPALARAWYSGRLRAGHVRAVLANISDATLPQFEEQEAAIVDAIADLDVAATTVAMRHWAARANASLDEREPPHPNRSLHLSETLDGRAELSASLDPDAHAVARAALRLAERPDVKGEPTRSAAQRRADALVDIAQFFLDHQQTARGGRHRPHVNVLVPFDGSGPASTLDGIVLSRAETARLRCDSTLTRVLYGPAGLVDVGRATRSVPAPLWTALVVRDRGCRFPGCDRPVAWCEAHHVVPWERGGRTDRDNLVLLCTRHHHLTHREGWQTELAPDAELVVTTPRGTVLRSRPPPV